MAGLGEVKITLTNDIVAALEKVSEELKAAKDAMSEERIRQIVREELTANGSQSNKVLLELMKIVEGR